MDVRFESSRLSDLIEDNRKRQRKFGPENAQLILQRLDNLRFAENLAVMQALPGRFHQLSGDRAGAFALVLKHGYRLIMAPAENPAPRRHDGGLDLEAITSVIILGVEDYHD